LADALKGLPQSVNPNLLVGFNKADDAGVYRLDDRTALVQTVDFFPPIVDDPYFFGQIAAANALSDVFAMGGRPLTALNIVGFPAATMPGNILADILRGGNDKIEEAGAVVVGGHSIKDKELKYGVSVTGVVDPSRIITNAGARAGDKLFLTKPLGTGIITTGIKRKVVPDDLAELVIKQMAALNQKAAELMLQHDVHAATDITGFGLLGHAFEVACASDVSLRFFADRLPILPEAERLAGEGVNPGGANDNKSYLECHVQFDESVPETVRQVLYDPQTSGGLLISVPSGQADLFSAALQSNGLPSSVIGEVIPKEPQTLIVQASA
jgi:selenide,water dikinase